MIPSFAGGAIFVPTPDEAVTIMMKLAEINPADIVTDFGSGDGKLLIAGAKAEAKKCYGYEIQPWLIKLSRKLIKQEKFEDRIEILPHSFWHADVSNTTVVLIYQISYAMKGIEEKLLKELPIGARVISNGFKFPNWKGDETIGNVRLYICR